MSELAVLVGSGAVGSLCGVLGAYAMIRKYANTEAILNIVQELLEEVATNTELQNRIYMIGGILGTGIKNGIGLPGSGKGKFKLEDTIGLLVQSFLPKILGAVGGQEQPQQSSETFKTEY